MLTIASATRIFLFTGATDMRKSYDALSSIVSGTLNRDPYTGDLYLFSNRRRNRLKVLLWDGSGFWVCAKRLEGGTFAWPDASEKTIDLSPEELWLLLGGIDLRDAVRRRWYTRPGREERKSLLSQK
jgi:transposase